MDANRIENVPLELRVTVKLLLDTEKKIEVLRNQLGSLERSESPTLKLSPPNSPGSDLRDTPIAKQRAAIQGQIRDLTQRSLGIVEDIEKGSLGKISQRVGRLKQEWIQDLEPAGAQESKGLYESQKTANRLRNKDWAALERPVKVETPFEQNRVDIVSQSGSYLDKARGLANDSPYLDKEPDTQVPSGSPGPPSIEEVDPEEPDI